MFITGQIACQITAALEQEFEQWISAHARSVEQRAKSKEQRILFNIFLDGQKN